MVQREAGNAPETGQEWPRDRPGIVQRQASQEWPKDRPVEEGSMQSGEEGRGEHLMRYLDSKLRCCASSYT